MVTALLESITAPLQKIIYRTEEVTTGKNFCGKDLPNTFTIKNLLCTEIINSWLLLIILPPQGNIRS